MHWLIGALVSPVLLSEGNAALLNNQRRKPSPFFIKFAPLSL